MGSTSGSGFARRHGRATGLPIRLIDDLLTWTVVGGFLAGHVLDQLFYFPHVLGERYVDGVVRHNLGLEEALFIAVVAALFHVLGRKARPAGFFVGLLAMLYAPVRFGLDTLRIDDARYFGWTPAQYGAACLLLVGLAVIITASRRDGCRALVDRWSGSP
jgi:phosphatidylglycerol:prolipoprotein diacylglycerol transferase